MPFRLLEILITPASRNQTTKISTKIFIKAKNKQNGLVEQ
jgi:hypothetical protein